MRARGFRLQPLLGSALLAALPLFAAGISPVRAQAVDILGLVQLEDVLRSFPHEIETFEYGGPIAHFPNGVSIAMSEDGDLERIDIPPDGWSCRVLHFFFVRAEAQACPDDFTDDEHQALDQAEAYLIEAYTSFVEDAGVSVGWTSIERRFELRAVRLASITRLAMLCRGEPRSRPNEFNRGFLTEEGVQALTAFNLRPVIALLPWPNNQCTGFD